MKYKRNGAVVRKHLYIGFQCFLVCMRKCIVSMGSGTFDAFGQIPHMHDRKITQMDQFWEIADSVLVLILPKAYLEIKIWGPVGFWEITPGTKVGMGEGETETRK